MDDNDDNIIPYRTSPTLTVKQAVMYMLGYRGEYRFESETESFTYDIHDYLYHLQEEADCAVGNANYELWELRQSGDASPEAIESAEGKVKSAKAELEKANKLPELAEQYRLLINHEVKGARLGKRNSLVIDEDMSSRTGQVCINKASFLEWLEDMDLDDTGKISSPVKYPLEDEALEQAIEKASDPIESVFFTLGLLTSLFAESGSSIYGTGKKPNVNSIAKAIAEYAIERNDGHKVRRQSAERIKDRIEPALSLVYNKFKSL